MRLALDPRKPIRAREVPASFGLALLRCGATDTTVRQYRRHAEHFIEALATLDPAASKDIRKLETRTLLQYLDGDLIGEGGKRRSAATRAVRINAVRSLLRSLDTAGALRRCAPSDLVAPRIPPPATPTVVPAHRRPAFFAKLAGTGSPTDQVTHAAAMVILMTGLRVSETCGLSLSSLDLYAGTASVRIKGGATVNVSLAPELTALLHHYVTYIRPQLLGSRTAPDALFVTRAGRLSGNELARRFRVAGLEIGLGPKQYQPHKVRATAITMVAVAQGPLQAMVLANHRRLETTLRYVARDEVAPATVAARQGAQAAQALGLPALPTPAYGTARSVASAAVGLSVRQRQVFELIGQGRNARQVAAVLGLSHATARRHQAELYANLGGAALARRLAETEVRMSAAA